MIEALIIGGYVLFAFGVFAWFGRARSRPSTHLSRQERRELLHRARAIEEQDD